MAGPREIPFTDLAGGQECALVIPPGGLISGKGDAKIGVRHPGCERLADLAADLDAFFCPECRWNGRVSGAWCHYMIKKERGLPGS